MGGTSNMMCALGLHSGLHVSPFVFQGLSLELF